MTLGNESGMYMSGAGILSSMGWGDISVRDQCPHCMAQEDEDDDT